MSSEQPLLVHITNIPTPYRIAFFNTLQTVLTNHGYGLHVFYCAEREPGRNWKINFDEICYPYEILPGVSFKIGYLPIHLNPWVIYRLRQLKPKLLLIAGGWNMPTALLASNLKLTGPVKRIFWSEGHADAVINRTGLIAYVRRNSYKSYNAFAVPNVASAHFLELELGFQPRLLPLPNTVDEDFYRAAQTFDKIELRSKLGLPINATIFVSVANLEERKGVRELVNAMRSLDGGSTSPLLILVGDGPLREELTVTSELLPGVIRIVGYQDAVRVREYLAASDAFVLSTKRDPNPLVVIEAAFAGLPLLVSHAAGNVSELVREGISGMIIPAVNDNAIATTLACFEKLNKIERYRLGRGASQLAEESFCRRSVAESFVTALLNL